jgi:hypothetical protein
MRSAVTKPVDLSALRGALTISSPAESLALAQAVLNTKTNGQNLSTHLPLK